MLHLSEFGEYIKQLRESKNMTLNQVAMYSEISAAQLSRIETGKRGVPKPLTIEKIAQALRIDYTELMKVAGYLEDNSKEVKKKEKDEKDIAKKLESILDELNDTSALAFDGEPMNENTRDLVKAQIESNLRVAKEMARKKFTPVKHRKDDKEK